MKRIVFLILVSIFFSVGYLTLAQESTSTPPTSTPEATSTSPQKPKKPQKPQRPKLDLSCVKSVVEKREDDLKTVRDVYFNKVNQAFENRKTALLNAWSIEDTKKRLEAIRKAWSDWKKQIKSAKLEYREAKDRVWKDFFKNRKKCKSTTILIPAGESQMNDLDI